VDSAFSEIAQHKGYESDLGAALAMNYNQNIFKDSFLNIHVPLSPHYRKK